jgi:DNA-binding phage protein
MAETLGETITALNEEKLVGEVTARADFKRERRAYRNLKNKANGGFNSLCSICETLGLHKLDCPKGEHKGAL